MTTLLAAIMLVWNVVAVLVLIPIFLGLLWAMAMAFFFDQSFAEELRSIEDSLIPTFWEQMANMGVLVMLILGAVIIFGFDHPYVGVPVAGALVIFLLYRLVKVLPAIPHFLLYAVEDIVGFFRFSLANVLRRLGMFFSVMATLATVFVVLAIALNYVVTWFRPPENGDVFVAAASSVFAGIWSFIVYIPGFISRNPGFSAVAASIYLPFVVFFLCEGKHPCAQNAMTESLYKNSELCNCHTMTLQNLFDAFYVSPFHERFNATPADDLEQTGAFRCRRARCRRVSYSISENDIGRPAV